MKERGMPFSDEMVRQALAGRKTQTRRVIVMPEPDRAELTLVRDDGTAVFRDRIPDDPCPLEIRSRYGAVGDHIWVRETWAQSCTAHSLGTVVYRATESARFMLCEDLGEGEWVGVGRSAQYRTPARWKPARFMPRRAARTVLEITALRVQRLHQISDDDAEAEGMPVGKPVPARINGKKGVVSFFRAREAFPYIWDTINGARDFCAWKFNPWVFAYTFRLVESASRLRPARSKSA